MPTVCPFPLPKVGVGQLGGGVPDGIVPCRRGFASFGRPLAREEVSNLESLELIMVKPLVRGLLGLLTRGQKRVRERT